MQGKEGSKGSHGRPSTGKKEMQASWLRVCRSPVGRAQIAVTTVLAALLLTMTMLIWRYTTSMNRSQAEKMAVPQRQQLLMLAKEKFAGLLQQYTGANQAIARAFQSKRFNNSMPFSLFKETAFDILWPTFRSSKEIEALTFANTLGYIVSTIRAMGYLALDLSSTNLELGTFDSVVIDSDTGEDIMRGPPVDVGTNFRTTDLWKQVANTAPLHTILDVTALSATPFLAVTTRVGEGNFDAPSSSQGFSGIQTLTVNLDSIAQFISNLSLMGGRMYISTPNGNLVAVSDGSPVLSKDSFQIQVHNSSQAVIAGTATFLEKRYGSHGKLLDDDYHFKDVILQGQAYYVDTTPIIYDDFGLIVVVIVPRVRFLGSVEKATKKLAIFLGCLAGVALAVGAVVLVVMTMHMGDKMKLKKELLEQLEANKRAEAATQSSRQFLANLSHDIRTPMAAVIGLLDVMKDDGLHGEQAYLMEQIQSSASMLDATLSSILDISSIEAGKLQLSLEPLDLRQELESIVDLFSVEGMNKGVDILLDLPGDIPKLLGDSMRIRQIFSNLVSNCVKFTSSGYVLIRCNQRQFLVDESRTPGKGTEVYVGANIGKMEGVTSQKEGLRSSFETARVAWKLRPRQSRGTTRTDSDNKRLQFQFEVEDTGSDLLASQSEAIFENFISMPEKHSRYGGQGIGLGIVRSLVQSMGGIISVVDKTGPGVLFRFTLILDLNNSSKEGPTIIENDTTISDEYHLTPRELTVMNPSPELQLRDAHQRSCRLVHVLLAMPPSMHTSLTSEWFRTRGHIVVEVGSMEDVPQRALDMCSTGLLQPLHDVTISSNARKTAHLAIIDYNLVQEPQEQFFTSERLLEFHSKIHGESPSEHRNASFTIAWAIPPSAPIGCHREVKTAGCVVIQKPLLSTRLEALMSSMEDA